MSPLPINHPLLQVGRWLSGLVVSPLGLIALLAIGAVFLGGAYTVSVYDTAGVAAQCVTALQKAVIEDGATIVIGPLTKEEAATCAPATRESGTTRL